MILVDGIEDAGVPADDPGLLLGWTAFDTLRCYGSVPFRQAEHLDRLEASAARLRVPMPPRALLEAEVARGVAPDHRIRVTLTAGGHRIVDSAPIPPGTVGRDLRVGRLSFDPPEALPGTLKHGSRLAWRLAALARGVEEVLLISSEGHVLEANRSGVFAVAQGALWTPPLDGRLLPSVTRGALLEAASDIGMVVREQPLPSALAVDELYLVSTLKELSPVVEVDGVAGPGGGPVGRRLHEAFRALVARECGQGASATV